MTAILSPSMLDAIATPFILIDAPTVHRNLQKMAAYAASHGLKLRPHAKTHKSKKIARLQLQAGAAGLTVAKPGEAAVMADVCDDLLMAYPAIDPRRCADLAALAKEKTLRVGIDSTFAADRLSAAAIAAGSTIGILVDLDVGHHRTGAQNPADALALAQYIDRRPGLRLDGVMFFPGQLPPDPAAQQPGLSHIGQTLQAVLDLWGKSGLNASIVSGGSTPSASQSHLLNLLTEIRPGTYVYNDMNGVYGRSATLNDCAARIIATVVSTAVEGQIVLDAGSKTLSSDRCGPAPESGHGYIIELPGAKIVKLSEEHAQVDVTRCERPPGVGQRLTLIPNHICPCINLQDVAWWREESGAIELLRIDARGAVY